ncbi:phospho-sugar mutase [Sporosarcina gallistercoris]|uniref:Phosphoglucomutase n=1 Tax=Sporosarcina gallistercoris TaxID=2762245 RepID=A0ABR8PMJ0_9BACL|nr:phospho-sugar mutase [Sporosarcina gallistercoris]
MDPQTAFQQWVAQDDLMPDVRTELLAISEDETEIVERFYRWLEFGTGGMRGLLGAGTNRMNIYTIRRVAEGLARMIEEHGKVAVDRGVAIAYDTRYLSKEFAYETAAVLASHGIRSYVFAEPRPTPELSFAIRECRAFSGVVITASHNPKEYNGFKVYGEDGGQLPPEKAESIVTKMNEIEDLFAITALDETGLENSGLLTMLSEQIDDAYQTMLNTLQGSVLERDDIKIVYTPLHGTGNVPVQRGLKEFGYRNVFVVPEQEKADPAFPTVEYPNPEEQGSFLMAIQLGAKLEADLLLATDPDADRLGAAIALPTGGYELLTGNQLGALLLNYILEQRQETGTLPSNGVILKTIVTSEMGRAIAARYGVKTEDTLTGFKYISEKVEKYHSTGEFEFLFGYEESYGYLAADFVREKDAVQAALLIAEAATFYKSHGTSLHGQLQKLYKEVGYYKEALRSITLTGKAGEEQIAGILRKLRDNPPKEFGGVGVTSIEDYQTGIIKVVDGVDRTTDLPSSNVLKFWLEDGSWCCIRPSGTEPKCKIYIGVRGETGLDAIEKCRKLEESFMTAAVGIEKPII